MLKQNLHYWNFLSFQKENWIQANQESVIVDCNHPLVDKSLDIELEIIDVK